jgi:uncharacterized protein
MTASARERINVMNYLLAHGEVLDTPDGNGDTALFYASATSKTESIAWLLAHGASTKSFRKDGITPFMITLQNGNERAFDLFLTNENQVRELNIANEDGWTPIFFAVRKQDPVLLQKLLNLGANPQVLSNDLESPLTLADEQQWKEGIALLKKKKLPKKKSKSRP